jgi:hypothetical protein
MKKNIFLYLLVSVVLFSGTTSLSSCARRGTGCPAESAHTKVDRKGNSKKGKSNLFPRDVRKKMGV